MIELFVRSGCAGVQPPQNQPIGILLVPKLLPLLVFSPDHIFFKILGSFNINSQILEKEKFDLEYSIALLKSIGETTLINSKHLPINDDIDIDKTLDRLNTISLCINTISHCLRPYLIPQPIKKHNTIL